MHLKQPLYRPTPAAIALLLALMGSGTGLRAEELAERRSEQATRYRGQLDELANWCQAQGLEPEARQTRTWAVEADSRQWTFYDLPVEVGSLAPRESDSALMAEWRKRLQALRQGRGEELFALAQQAIAKQRVALAFDLLGEALRQNPDLAEARHVLGYEQHDGQWLRPYEIAKQRAGQVWHEQFGWLSEAHVGRYEAGERNHRGRWISAEHDARLHASIDTGWELETEHFSIVTNHSLRTAARFGAELERLAEVWQRLFPAYLYSQAELVRLFDGGRVAAPRKRHQVIVFRNQDEYRQALRGEIPDDVVTTGVYIGRRRTAYYFVTDAVAGQEPPKLSDRETLLHEAVHQLFGETRRVPPDLGREANFWIIEGVACYFESLARHEGFTTLGGPESVRLLDARHRCLREGFYVPLAELSQLGMSQLQRHPQIAKLYTQSAGLTHFLMHDGNGQFRDALSKCLLAVYSGRDRASTLAEAAGQEYPELDRQYRQFLTRLEPLPDRSQ